MTVLTDNEVEILWFLSPRVIFVYAPRTEIIVQDLHDTCREREQRQENLIYNHLINTAGKEPLGGGVTVGLTATLNNAVIAFQARKTSVSSGLVTSTDLTGTYLIDNTADFIADGVVTGAYIVNESDQSTCTVLRVVDGYTLYTDVLGDGYTNTFTVGDTYKVWNVTQCTVSGGNVVAVDGYGSSISPILPTVGTQVRTTASSSATLQELLDIQYSSFNGVITIDIVNGTSGTTYPTGTPRQPVNNFTDALTIANARGITTLKIRGDATIDTGLDYSNITFVGDSMSHSLITISSAANVFGCEFQHAEITGTLDGGCTLVECRIHSLNYVDGVITSCLLSAGANIVLSGSAQATFLNCWSDAADEADVPYIDCGGAGSTLNVRNYAGSIAIKNKTGLDNVAISILNGHIFVDSTVINGEVELSGVGYFTDNSTGSAVVKSYELINTVTLAAQVAAATSNLKYLIESQAESHGSFGNAYYWDPLNGSDGYAGTSPDAPAQTFAHIHDTLVTDGNNDVVFLIGNPVGYGITERITISKNNVNLRGPGGQIALFQPIDDGGPTITITGYGVGIKGLNVTTMSGGAPVDGILSTSSYVRIDGSYIHDCAGNGISIQDGYNCHVDDCIIRSNTGDGVNVTNAKGLIIHDSSIVTNDGYGISMNSGVDYSVGTVVDNCTVKWNGIAELYTDPGIIGMVIRNNCDIDQDAIILESAVYFNAEEVRYSNTARAIRPAIIPLYSKL